MKTEENVSDYEVGKTYIVHWRPTTYLYKHIGKLIKDHPSTLIFDVNVEDTVRVQKKFIQYIIEE